MIVNLLRRGSNNFGQALVRSHLSYCPRGSIVVARVMRARVPHCVATQGQMVEAGTASITERACQ